MSEVTYYVALPFVLSDDGVATAEAIELQSERRGHESRGAVAQGRLRRRRRLQPQRGSRNRRLRRRPSDPEIRRRPGRPERPMKIDWVRNETTRMRVQIRAHEREIRMLQRAGASTVSAEALLARMRFSVHTGLPCCPSSRCVRAVATTPVELLGAYRSLPQQWQLSL
jgi:hypothetical protein